MVRGSFSISLTRASDRAPADRTRRLVPALRRDSVRSGGALPTAAPHQEIAIAVDAPAFAGLARGKPIQIVARDRLKPLLLPAVERGHEMAGKAFDDRVGIDHLKTFAEQRHAGCSLHLLDMRHVGGAQDDAEHQPVRNLVFRAIPGPAEPRAAQQSLVEQDGVGPDELYLALRRAMRGNGVGKRVHAGKERPPRRGQRLVGLEHDGEFDQIVAAHPDQRGGARLARDLAAMRKGVAELAQRDQSITGRQVECLFRVRETRHRKRILIVCRYAPYVSPATPRRERSGLAGFRATGYRETTARSNRVIGTAVLGNLP